MIASRRGLAILAGIAVVLGIWVLVDLASSTAPVDRALVPGFDPARVTNLVWPDIELARTGTTWKAGAALVDPDAVTDVLRTLQGARWHRRAEPSSAGQLGRWMKVDGRQISIGAAVPGTDQVWVVLDDHAMLVDGWVARALDRTPLDLRVRHPLASAARAQTLTISTGAHTVVLAGHPRRYGSAGDIANASDVRAIEQMLADLEIVAIPPHVGGAKTGEVHIDAVALEVHGVCERHPDLVAVTGTYGDGCIRADVWQAVAHVIDDRLGEQHAVDPRPVPVDPVTATLLDGTVVTFGPPPRAGDKDADRDRVAELRSALTSDGTIVGSGAGSGAGTTDKAIGTIAVVDHAGTHWDVEVLSGNLVRRTVDHVVLRIAAWPMLQRPGTAYLDPTRWSEDRFAVTEVALDGVTYARGAVIGEWTRTPPGAVAPDKLEVLAAALATVRAPLATETAKPTHKVTVKLAPPVGEPATHTLEVGPGCLGTVDGQRVRFEPGLCTAISAVAK